jgi:serine phosphatase RsbU (regulator of sigma subunit)
VLVVLSDGVTEAGQDPDSEFFGEGLLEVTLKKAPRTSAQETVATLRQALDDFLGDTPRADDATMVVLRRSS